MAVVDLRLTVPEVERLIVALMTQEAAAMDAMAGVSDGIPPTMPKALRRAVLEVFSGEVQSLRALQEMLRKERADALKSGAPQREREEEE